MQLTDFLAPGFIVAFAGTTAPEGWHLCDGSPLTDETPHVALRAMLLAAGSPFGADAGNPRVPDMRGRTPIGAGAGAGLTARTLAATGGAEAVALTAAQLASHTHGSGTISAESAGAHQHTQGTLVTASGGAHVHSEGSLATTSVAGHTHASGTLETSSAGSHTHQLYAEGGTGGTVERVNQASNGGSSNQIDAVEAAGNHNHNIFGSTASAGGHSHAVTGDTATGGAHTHAISGSVASSGAHTHTTTGSTASAGTGEAHPNMQPWIALNYVIKG